MSPTISHRVARWAVVVLSTTGFALDLLSGCSDQNKTTVYGGLEQFASSLTNAFFIQLGQQQGFTFTPVSSTGT